MTTRSVDTTTSEDESIAYSYTQWQKMGSMPIGPPGTPLPTTEAQYFQAMTNQGTVTPMVALHQRAKNDDLIKTLGTIPPEQQAAAKADIETVVVQHGGSLPLRTAKWQMSTNTAPPPRTKSLELNVTQANIATVNKLTFDYLDADGVDRMAALMLIASGTLVKITDAANAANFVQALTMGIPVQRQGANGYAEFTVYYKGHGGTLADLLPMTVTFS
jgi:hypothetical protein